MPGRAPADRKEFHRPCRHCKKLLPFDCFRVSMDAGHEGKPYMYCLDCEELKKLPHETAGQRGAAKRGRIVGDEHGIAAEVEAAGDTFEAMTRVAAARKGVLLAALYEKALTGDAATIKLWFDIAGRPKGNDGEGDEEWRGLQRGSRG